MYELFFGAKRSKSKRGKRSPKRGKRSPVRRRARSPPKMCRKGLTLSKLRKLAMENGVNVYSEAPTRVSKRTGERLKPKMVSCATLEKRLKDAGLESLYRRRMPVVDVSDDVSDLSDLSDDEEPMLLPPVKSLPQSVLMQADPACHDVFQSLALKQPNNRLQAKFLKQYKGYAMGQGPCDKRQLVPTHVHGDEDDVKDYADEAGFDMLYGRRYLAGARPKKTQKHAGEIVVKGRVHQVFRGKEGGLYYLKGKSGNKIYVDKKRLKRKSPKRR